MAQNSQATTVLIADDHALLVDIIEIFLAGEGEFSTRRADSLESVLAAIAEHGSFDIILLDLDMPGMNGLQGLEKAVAANKNGRVVLFSGQARQEAVFRALELGASGYIPKTSSAKSLTNAIRFVVSGETYIPSSLTSAMARSERKGQASNMTAREMDVLRGICKGETNKEIARELGLTEISVKMHVRSVFSKMNVSNRTQVAMISVASGLV